MAHPFAIVISSMALAGFIMIALQVASLLEEAKKMDLPILFSPFDILSPIFAMAPDRIIDFFNGLPLGLGQWINWSHFHCFWANKYTLHERYGPVFVVITPSSIVVHVAEAAAAEDILNRRKDFIKSPAMYKPLEILGPNVDTLNGEDWQRHRRLTTPPFNERNSSHVWKESLIQARDMLKVWMRAGKNGVVKSSNDTMTLALHVLTSAGFGKSYDFEGGVTKAADGRSMTYRTALKIIMNHVFIMILISSLKLPGFILTKKLQEVKVAITEFKLYMAEMVEEERSTMETSDTEKDNLMSVLVRASSSEKGRNGLSTEEIHGNLFIYNLAGHDTTANTLAFAVNLMSTDQKWQEWIREELIQVLGDKDNIEDWEYESAFPKLKRCLALMHETLRLYGPIVTIPKYTIKEPVTTTIMGSSTTIPANSYVLINVAALHTSPEYWGDDALIWRPDRWIIPSPKIEEEEELFEPSPGTFLAWASGPRVCPGKKFSQVEFVAVIARLFRRNRVRVRLEEGETEEMGKERVWKCVGDSALNITLQMRHPERVALVWEEC